MSTQNGTPNGTSNGATTTPAESGPRKLKILMLHGYTQSGPTFNSKTKALTKLLTRQFPPTHPIYPGGIQLLYPTAPIPLLPADIPGYTPSSDPALVPNDAFGWWKRETGGARYTGNRKRPRNHRQHHSFRRRHRRRDWVFPRRMRRLPRRLAARAQSRKRICTPTSSFAIDRTTLSSIFPQSKIAIASTPLKFCISYSGFSMRPMRDTKHFFNPPLKTRILHVIGSLDSVVEESRSTALVEACEEETREVCYHPGGHFVPMGKEFGNVAVGFMVRCLEEKKPVAEESVEDMDVPF
ncbi:hypothetical protein EYC84_002252 [Monilinia fructicola]|uniref:Serine hydrolase domain-containing protein n=1 Tax=Monilinia fructicola TaxID=38448 RepID=A0A5M9JQ28_MONFR|nr:hypothetical protein EYC84_002252 [Monilinia fructicola]